MKKYVVLFFVGILVSYLAGLANNNSPVHYFAPNTLHAGNHVHQPAAQTLYTCPMHPQIVQEQPGQCPICGMDLVPQRNPDQKKEESGDQSTIRVDPVTVQNMSVRVDKVKRGVVYRHIRTFGRLEIPEDALAVVNLRFSGWVEKLWADKLGKYVKKGGKLFAIYSPEVFSTQKEYILALKRYGEKNSITESAESRLRLWGVPAWQIKAIRKEMEPKRLITITSPASGFIEKMDIAEGSRIASGKNLFTIIDLEKVWLIGEVYDFDAPWVKNGAQVEIDFSIPGLSKHQGKISYIYPTLNPQTRTLTVRVEMENPDLRLKPGMIAGMLINAQSEEERLVIPSESIIHTGKRKIVFITKTLGRYQPREVETGLVGDNYVTEVISGVEEGETVVTSGQFLLDSESQLQEAVNKFLENQLQSTQRADTHEHTDEEISKVLYTCPMHPQIVQEQPGQCPICGMDLVKKK
ncbi:MAG: efflux RND transporter periplasmic adaptor subunit [Deltaproteobacteria bacterium]|nr:efflux RND transporter periplasmic adaptor subunit [Deltaproteobacteria bacterium]